MARGKSTIMLDRGKAERVRELSSSTSISDAVEIALDRYIADDALRRDVAAYLRAPLTPDELAPMRIPVQFDLDDDNNDYEALYGEPR